MKITKPEVHETAPNIFVELGFPDAGSHFLKAQIVAELYRLATIRKLSQAKVGTHLGISQPEVSRLFKGYFREYSVERLIKFLAAFNRDVEIIARAARSRNRAGKITFTSEAA